MNTDGEHPLIDWADGLAEIVGRLIWLARDERAPRYWREQADELVRESLVIMGGIDEFVTFEASRALVDKQLRVVEPEERR